MSFALFALAAFLGTIVVVLIVGGAVAAASWDKARQENAQTELIAQGRREALAERSPQAGGTGVTLERRGGAADRCPYCHDDARSDSQVACAACLARHHVACWDEHGECAACGGRDRFASVERTPGRERPGGAPDLKA